MKKRQLDIEEVVADYYCDLCGRTVQDIPIYETIAVGIPTCEDCNREMILDAIFLLKEN